ncbi:hypothetical protein MIND_00625900 [Mycena indigotica]|uniref:Uncharacterized protein n=1 Tax=Mycena indigotica TaxID=2126181 RepID=A0A8H6SS94_9AGAR|nr:uncharacterized protein MIND_00625900 [Mycena indigotica]KAF7303952.1 hypothetical protein MIND_00625900 [Mycena indigotica]
MRLSEVHGPSITPLLKILLIWLFGVALVIAHHIYGSQLNNRTVHFLTEKPTATQIFQSQPGASAVGTTIAYLVSAALSTSVGIAFIQCAWKLVRARALTVGGLDALWSAPYSYWSFFEWDFWRTARGVVLVAILMRAFPLVVTFAPGTLTVHNVLKSTMTPCDVPSFNFGSNGLLFETLNSAATPYSQPSSLALRTVGATILAGKPFSPTSPCTGNCNYNVEINAPSFNCTSSLKNTSALPSSGDPSHQLAPPPYVAAAFDATPSIQYKGWDFQAHYLDYSHRIPVDPTRQGKDVSCVAYDSTYHINYTFFGSTPSVVIERIEQNQSGTQLSIGTNTFIDGSSSIHSSLFNVTTNYYAVLASLYTYLAGNISASLTGNSLQFTPQPANLAATQTQLVAASGGGNITWADLPTVLESLLQNITLSILTLDRTQTTKTSCMTFSSEQHFTYDAYRLWLVYGPALAVALLCNIVGALALMENGFGATDGFSDFLAATRYSELREVDSRQRVRLKYGMLRGYDGRYAFAKPEDLLDGRNVGTSTATLGQYKEVPLLSREAEGVHARTLARVH